MPVLRRPVAAIASLLAALTLCLPAVALASGGGSAGDQQYTDPFGSSTPAASGTTGATTTAPAASSTPAAGSTPATSSTPAPGTAPSSTPSPSSSTPSSSAPDGSGSTAPAASDPGTPSSGPTATTAAGRGAQLPYTGYDGGLAAAVGAGLVAAGIILRRRTRRA